MTEFEISQQIAAAIDNSISCFTLFLSIITAYVMVAFLAGTRLTRSQLAWVNALFLLSSTAAGVTFITLGRRVSQLVQSYDQAIQPVIFAGGAITNYLIPAIVIGMIFGSLHFMWGTRRQSDA